MELSKNARIVKNTSLQLHKLCTLVISSLYDRLQNLRE